LGQHIALRRQTFYIATTEQLLGFPQYLSRAPTYVPSSKVAHRDGLKNTRLFLFETISDDQAQEKINTGKEIDSSPADLEDIFSIFEECTVY
jgi:hypothetical protein